MSRFVEPEVISLQEMLAVALAYKAEVDKGPWVIAKGKGAVAANIIEVAQDHGILIKQDPSLVTILSMVEIGDMIPPDIFLVVAEIISYIYLQEENVRINSHPEPK